MQNDLILTDYALELMVNWMLDTILYFETLKDYEGETFSTIFKEREFNSNAGHPFDLGENTLADAGIITQTHRYVYKGNCDYSDVRIRIRQNISVLKNDLSHRLIEFFYIADHVRTNLPYSRAPFIVDERSTELFKELINCGLCKRPNYYYWTDRRWSVLGEDIPTKSKSDIGPDNLKKFIWFTNKNAGCRYW